MVIQIRTLYFIPASKNENKQTVASEESEVEEDMINFELSDGHGYLLSTNCSFSSSIL